MRVRGSYIAVSILGILTVLIVAVLMQSNHPVMEPPKAVTQNTAGSVPAVGSDQAAIPKIEASTTEIDLGIISNKDVGKGNIILFNRGKKVLKLSPQVATQCSCTTGSFDEKVDSILPGEQTTLHVQVDPLKMHTVDSTKVLTIVSDDPITPRLDIKVSAHVKPEYAIEPNAFDFGKVSKGQAAEREVKVSQLEDEPLEITKVDLIGGPKGVDASFERIPEDKWKTPGKAEYIVKARLNESVIAGPIGGHFALKTKFLRMPSISVNYTGLVDSFYKLSMANITLRGMVGDANCGQLRVSAADPIELKDVQVTNENIVLQVKPGNIPNEMDIVLGSKPGTNPGVQRGEVSFVVASATQGSVKEKVPFVGYMRPPGGITTLPAAGDNPVPAAPKS